MKLNTILSSREKKALDLLETIPKIKKNGGVEFKIKKGHVVYLRIRWMDLRGELNLLKYMRNLEILRIENCKISPIPEEFALLTKVKSLTISFFDMEQNYVIEDLLPTIFCMSSLEELTLEKVIIDEELENAIGDLGDLVKLNLNHCGFSHFPKSFCNLNELTDISLAGNDINEFPDELLLFPKIEKFFINNQIKGDYRDEH